MNKKLPLIAVAIVILAVVGFGAYSQFSKKQAPAAPADTNQAAGNANGLVKKSLRELMAMNSNQTCTFKDELQNTGTTYVAGGKLRTDVSSMVDGQATTTHMISDGNFFYMWTDGSLEGFKMAIPAEEVAQVGVTQAPTNNSNVDVDQQVDLDCKAWRVDTAMFELPTDVNFRDLSALMQNAVKAMPSVVMPSTAALPGSNSDNEDRCASCVQLSGDAAVQCRQALGCN